jgi:hypothetical protein
MKLVLLSITVALCVLAFSTAGEELHGDQATVASQIVIPRVEYVDVSAIHILQQVQRMSEQRDPAKRGVRIIVDDTLPTSMANKTLTFTMDGTSVLNIAKHVANVAGLEVDPRKDGIHIRAPR